MNRRSNLTNRTVLAIALSALIAGLAIQSMRQTSTTAPEMTPASPETPTGPGPRSIDDGIPTGFAQSEAGAIAAAASYTTTGQALIDLAPTQLPGAVSQYASAETAAMQVDKLVDDMASLREVLAKGSGRIRYLKAVLATRLDAYAPERATVRVWTVGVLWRQGAADPQADWTTSTFELVWEDGTWKVLAESIESGPAPAPNGGTPPVDATELDRQLEGFVTWGVAR